MDQTGSAERIDLVAIPTTEEGAGTDYETFEERRLAGNVTRGEVVLNGLATAGQRINEVPVMTRIRVIAANTAAGRADVVFRSDLLGLVWGFKVAMKPETGKQGIGRDGVARRRIGIQGSSGEERRWLHFHPLETGSHLKLDGFGEEIIHAGVNAALDLLGQSTRRQRDDREVPLTALS